MEIERILKGRNLGFLEAEFGEDVFKIKFMPSMERMLLEFSPSHSPFKPNLRFCGNERTKVGSFANCPNISGVDQQGHSLVKNFRGWSVSQSVQTPEGRSLLD